MEQAEKEMPQKYMVEIVRWFNKLKEADLAVNDLVITDEKVIVNNKLQVTYSLKAGDTVIASYVMTDNRSLDTIKTEVEAQKTAIEAQKAELIAQADGILAVVDSKPAK